MTGRVKWFDVKKGYGFITQENGRDIFVHYSDILGDPLQKRFLEDGQLVSFDLVYDRKGPQARNVVKI